jgi:citrate synthase
LYTKNSELLDSLQRNLENMDNLCITLKELMKKYDRDEYDINAEKETTALGRAIRSLAKDLELLGESIPAHVKELFKLSGMHG